MIIRRISLPRRTFLRGMGATLALPFLDAMVPALSAMAKTAAPPRRLGFVYVPQGVNWMKWIPEGEGRGVQFLTVADATRAVPRPTGHSFRAPFRAF